MITYCARFFKTIPHIMVILMLNSVSAAEPTSVAVRCETNETSSKITYLSWDTEGTGREKQNLLEKDHAVTVEPADVTAHFRTGKAGDAIYLELGMAKDSRASSPTVTVTFPFDPRVTP